MDSYPSGMDLQNLRDWIVAVSLSGLSLAIFFTLLSYTFVGYKTLRAVRKLNRLNDEQLRRRVTGFNERMGEWINDDVFTISGLTTAGREGVRRVQERRKPKRGRFAPLGDALNGARARLPFGH